MKRIIHLLTAALAVLGCLTGGAQSVPPLINYQGQLLDASGNPMPTGDYDIEVRLFPVESGGAAIWGPQTFNGQSGTGLGLKAAVVQGRFNLVLGPQDTSGRDLASVFAVHQNVFLELKIGRENPISPRQQMLSAPFALNAANAANAANVLAGGVSTLALTDGAITAAKLDPTIGLWGRAGDNAFRVTGNVGIGTSNPEFPLDVIGTLTVRNTGEGAVALNLGIERSWAFRQLGAGAGTALELASVGGGGNKNFVINTTGLVGIGTTTPQAFLHISGPSGSHLRLHESLQGNFWTIYTEDHPTGADGNLLFVPGPGGVAGFIRKSSGTYFSNSDFRLKKEITNLSGVLDRLLQLRPVSYQFKSAPEGASRSLGLIAQEVETLFPEVVSESGGMKALAYSELVPVTVGAIQELNEKLEAKDAEIRQLTKRLERLEQLLNRNTANEGSAGPKTPHP